MVVSLFVLVLYMLVMSCAQYKHEAQSLIIHLWSQHPENPIVFRYISQSRLLLSLSDRNISGKMSVYTTYSLTMTYLL